MSNQENGFQGSQPFITDNEYKSLSLDQLRYILNQKKKTIKKSYKELSEKEKLIRDIRRLDKLNAEVKQGVDIKKKYMKKKAPVKTTGPSKKIKSFEEYFEECIKNKQIPPDTPSYLREALQRAMIEYDQGIIKEKSALEGFANKYIIQGEPGITVGEFFENIFETLQNFLSNHRNIKFKMVLVCLMEKQIITKDKGVVGLEEDKAYFHSSTVTNIESDDTFDVINGSYLVIKEAIDIYQKNGSGWYFKEVV